MRRALERDEDLHDDLLQEVGLALLQAIRRPSGVPAAAPAVSSWLRVAVPRIIRAKLREPAVLFFAAEPTNAEDSETTPTGEAVTSTTALDLLGERTSFEQCLASLNPRERAVVLARLDGASHAEVAVKFGMSEGAARIVLCKALRKCGIVSGVRVRTRIERGVCAAIVTVGTLKKLTKEETREVTTRNRSLHRMSGHKVANYLTLGFGLSAKPTSSIALPC